MTAATLIKLLSLVIIAAIIIWFIGEMMEMHRKEHRPLPEPEDSPEAIARDIAGCTSPSGLGPLVNRALRQPGPACGELITLIELKQIELAQTTNA